MSVICVRMWIKLMILDQLQQVGLCVKRGVNPFKNVQAVAV